MSRDYRRVMGEISRSERCAPLFEKPVPSNGLAMVGLQYERRVGKELAAHVDAGRAASVEGNPWFSFTDAVGSAQCSPDFLLHCDLWLFVIEVKLHWTPIAAAKLNDLYRPVVAKALGTPVNTLVICRNMVPGAPKPAFTMRQAMSVTDGLLLWPANGHIPW